MLSRLLKLCGAGFAAQSSETASLVGFEAHAKVYARKEKLLLSMLAGLSLAWISGLLSA